MSNTKVNIGLLNPKTPTNVGAVLRAAGCFRADGVLYTGERYDRAEKFTTDTQNTRLGMPLTAVNCLVKNKPADAEIVCIELVEGGVSLPEFQHPDNAFYIFGPEDGTINQAVIDSADAVVYIPTVGCLNLAATVNVVLYDRLLKSGMNYDGDTLIRKSRDTNNKVKVRGR